MPGFTDKDFQESVSLVSSAATLGYAVACLPDSIWKGQKWSVTLNNLLDGVVYGIVTVAVFGWLRPEGP